MKRKIINVHQREINQPIESLVDILDSLSSKEDLLWPKENWPEMKLNEGLAVGSSGGHGPIGYYVSQYTPGKKVEFVFTKPEDFIGFHRFELNEVSPEKCQILHRIEMHVNTKGYLTWHVAVRWLHDALLEDCFDKVENHFSNRPQKNNWNGWVKFLRYLLK